MARRKPRDPRPPKAPGLPATYDQALENEIIAGIEQWYSRIAAALQSESGRLVMRNELIRQLQTQASLTVAHVIAMADQGHVPAIEALRVHIATHLDNGGKWEQLSDQLRGWGIHKMMLAPVVSGYPEGGRLLVDTWLRDIAISFLVKAAIERWSLPQRPLPQRRAAEFVALVLSRHGIAIKRQQVQRIYRKRGTMAARIVEFMTDQF
jgi:hypothetical protein